MPSLPSPSPVRLPPETSFQLRTQLADGWSDNYGAIHLAARHADLELGARPYFLRGIWQHGVVGPWQDHAPETLGYASPMLGKWPLFVAREEQAAVLREAGFDDVAAIGMPFVYTPPCGVPRIPGSLLVVPTHTLYGATFADRAPFVRYAAYIRSIAHRFRRVVACVHPACVANGLWIREFGDVGIEVVTGTKIDDLNALARVRALFEQFECVTTNGWGSHVAYALACGARVSIHGEAIEEKPESVRNWLRHDETWSKRPDLLAAIHNSEVFAHRRSFLERLQIAPWEGVHDVAWGEWFLGSKHKLSPAEMRRVLRRLVDTDWDPAPEADRPPRWLFAVHEATRTGAPINLLHFLRWLRRETDIGFDILVGRGGPLLRDLHRVGAVFEAAAPAVIRPRLPRYSLLYANTVCCGSMLEKLDAPLPPTVTHVHELDGAYDFFGPVGMSLVLAQSRRFIACGEQVRDRLASRFGLAPATIEVVPETCDPAAVRAAAAEPPAAAGLSPWPDDAALFVGCGSRTLRKGTDLFVQVAAAVNRRWNQSRPLHFVWIGDSTEPDLARQLTEDGRKLGLEGILSWQPAVGNPFPAFARATAFCLTSREDPYPLVMLEAATLGLPIVAFSGSGGGPDFCAHGAGVAVPYLDTAAMAEALLHLAADPRRGASLGSLGRERAESLHAVDVVAPALHQLLRRYESEPWPPAVALNEAAARLPAGQVGEWAAYADFRKKLRDLVGESRRRAQLGDRAGAAKVLVQGANQAATSGNATVLVGSLVVLGDALSALEPTQGKYLLGEAARIASASGIRCESFRDPVWQRRPVPSSLHRATHQTEAAAVPV
jgi:glycosyltransferase involved in cell wall biosynthesis